MCKDILFTFALFKDDQNHGLWYYLECQLDQNIFFKESLDKDIF